MYTTQSPVGLFGKVPEYLPSLRRSFHPVSLIPSGNWRGCDPERHCPQARCGPVMNDPWQGIDDRSNRDPDFRSAAPEAAAKAPMRPAGRSSTMRKTNGGNQSLGTRRLEPSGASGRGQHADRMGPGRETGKGQEAASLPARCRAGANGPHGQASDFRTRDETERTVRIANRSQGRPRQYRISSQTGSIDPFQRER